MDNFNLKIGLSAEKAQTVDTGNTALAYGSGSIEVYATPAMVGLMENASLAAVDHLLPKGFATVGTKVEISHLAATPLGVTVTANAELVELDGKRLLFKVLATDEKGKIGEGLHERYIIEIAKFLNKANAK